MCEALCQGRKRCPADPQNLFRPHQVPTHILNHLHAGEQHREPRTRYPGSHVGEVSGLTGRAEIVFTPSRGGISLNYVSAVPESPRMHDSFK